MNEEVLSQLCCVQERSDNMCRGKLKLHRVFRRFDLNLVHKDWREAIIRCEQCGFEYPILGGIPILISSLGKYLRAHYYKIMGIAHLNGQVSPEMHAFIMQSIIGELKSSQEELFPRQFEYTQETHDYFLREVSPYLTNHYDDLFDLMEVDDPLFDFMKKFGRSDTYKVLDQILHQVHPKKGGVALEIGCHVGGLTARFADSFDHIFGVDDFFPSLMVANQIVNHCPTPMTTYPVYLERNRTISRPIVQKRRENVNFICASGTHLPFLEQQLDLVFSNNVIDIVSKPARLLEEKIRVLKSKGHFLLSDPYDFGPTLKESSLQCYEGPSEEKIKQFIATHVEISEEIDRVPWVSRKYGRNFIVYYNHCLVGTKRMAPIQKCEAHVEQSN